MGALLTYFYYGSNEPDPVTGLTPYDRYLIKSSWHICKKDLNKLGMELFILLFKKYPHNKEFFPFRDIPLEKFSTDKRVKAHTTSVAYALSSIVDNIDNPDVLVCLLHKTAESHARRRIPKESFLQLKEVTLLLLEQNLGNVFTTDCKNAWQKTLDVAFKVIIDRIEEELK